MWIQIFNGYELFFIGPKKQKIALLITCKMEHLEVLNNKYLDMVQFSYFLAQISSVR